MDRVAVLPFFAVLDAMLHGFGASRLNVPKRQSHKPFASNLRLQAGDIGDVGVISLRVASCSQELPA